jgi:hypothetical protein
MHSNFWLKPSVNLYRSDRKPKLEKLTESLPQVVDRDNVVGEYGPMGHEQLTPFMTLITFPVVIGLALSLNVRQVLLW